MVEIKKKFVIELDVISGKVDHDNGNELTYMEVLGMLEYVKMMMMQQLLEDLKE